MTQLYKIIRYFFHLLDHSIIQSFLTKIIIFDPNCHFWLKSSFLTQIVISDPNCHFRLKWSFLTQSVIFDPNCHFWSKWSFLTRAFWNEIKGRFRQRIRSFWPHLMERSFLTTMFFVIYELFIRQVYHRLVFVNPINSAFPNFMLSAPSIFRFHLVYSGFGSEFSHFSDLNELRVPEFNF